jgi:hypothetical protein
VIFGVLVDAGLPVDAAVAGLGLLAVAAILSLHGSGMTRTSA